jgi:hypothetical protein
MVMSSEWLAFIDESGNDGMDFSKPDVSRYYVLAAVVLRASEHRQAEAAFQRSKDTHFPSAPEMKSEYVGDKDDRRLKIVASLAKASFHLHLRITDKHLIHGPGFQYPSSFVKYLLGDLVSGLLDRYRAPIIVCDHIKTPAFEQEVRTYLESRYPRRLMQQWSLDFSDSTKDICVQAADIIAGTGYRCCARSPNEPEQDQLLQLLNKHLSIGSVRRFPHANELTTVDDVSHRQAYNPELEMKSVHEAEAFLARDAHAGEPHRAVLVACVQELLKNNTLQRDQHWVPTRRLVSACEEVLGEKVSARGVRSFVGRLRDEGLLIASRRSPGGYKLPNRMADIVEFVNTQNEKIRPMMRRIQKARNAVYGLSNSDILQDEAFENLRRLLPPVGTPADSI